MANENKFMETCRLNVWKCLFVDSRPRPIMGIYNKLPAINSSAFVAPNAAVIGDVKMASGSSVWYNAVVRGRIVFSSYSFYRR